MVHKASSEFETEPPLAISLYCNNINIILKCFSKGIGSVCSCCKAFSTSPKCEENNFVHK